MKACSPSAQHDFVANKKTYFLAWGAPVLILLLSWPIAMSPWLQGLVWATALAWMGGACLWNARRCGRWHCFFTGPFFLLDAIASLAIGFAWVLPGWLDFTTLGLILLIGTPVLHVVPDALGGTYVKARCNKC